MRVLLRMWLRRTRVRLVLPSLLLLPPLGIALLWSRFGRAVQARQWLTTVAAVWSVAVIAVLAILWSGPRQVGPGSTALVVPVTRPTVTPSDSQSAPPTATLVPTIPTAAASTVPANFPAGVLGGQPTAAPPRATRPAPAGGDPASPTSTPRTTAPASTPTSPPPIGPPRSSPPTSRSSPPANPSTPPPSPARPAPTPTPNPTSGPAPVLPGTPCSVRGARGVDLLGVPMVCTPTVLGLLWLPGW